MSYTKVDISCGVLSLVVVESFPYCFISFFLAAFLFGFAIKAIQCRQFSKQRIANTNPNISQGCLDPERAGDGESENKVSNKVSKGEFSLKDELFKLVARMREFCIASFIFTFTFSKICFYLELCKILQSINHLYTYIKMAIELSN